MKKKIVRIVLLSTIIPMLCVLFIATPVFAVPDDIVIVIANPSNTSITLSWLPAVGATSYKVQYKTTGFPTGTGDGTTAYSGTSTMTTISSLTAGQSYFFCVWGFDGALYSVNPAQRAITTLLVAVPSGAPASPTQAAVLPTIPGNVTQNATITGFNLEPFAMILAYSDNSVHGGLGMPLNNYWELLYILGMVVIGLLVYAKMRNFFISYFVVFILTCFGVALQLLQGYMIPIEIAAGLGVWAIERFLQ